MHDRTGGRGPATAMAILILLGTLGGLVAAYKRFHAEERNRRVEIALEWPEVTQLAQTSSKPVSEVLRYFKQANATTLVLAEDTLLALEEAGAVRPQRISFPTGGFATRVTADGPRTFKRIVKALSVRSYPFAWHRAGGPDPAPGSTEFMAPPGAAPNPALESVRVAMSYQNLRMLGIGLPPDALTAARNAHYYVAGRVANFPGLSPRSAEQVLINLREQGARIVIFNGDEVLGFRGMEDRIATLLNSQAERKFGEQVRDEDPESPTGLTYGAVEFSKQRGEDRLTGALHGDYIRIHTVSAAELNGLEEPDVIDRFALAVRERNIRFCFVRMFTFTGEDPVGQNVELLTKIGNAIQKDSSVMGGAFLFGLAHRFTQTGVGAPLFILLGLGTGAGAVWALRLLLPLSARAQTLLLVLLCLLCAALAGIKGDDPSGELGRRLVALLAGIAFPLAACLRIYPRADAAVSAARGACVAYALRGLLLASAITTVGIVHVVGLLATRPFMVRAVQFLGIKAQHATPVVIVALLALTGGALLPRETWSAYRDRVAGHVRAILSEPARFGSLLLVLVSLAAIYTVLSRTGNDTSVGASGLELKIRHVLDRVLPVRPRTKEFLIGHPALVLGLAWWVRGRRRLALPCFVVGAIGQVSLLNTFCHIHTSLIVSAWRDLLGLAIGALIGVAVFYVGETLLQVPARAARPERAEQMPEVGGAAAPTA